MAFSTPWKADASLPMGDEWARLNAGDQSGGNPIDPSSYTGNRVSQVAADRFPGVPVGTKAYRLRMIGDEEPQWSASFGARAALGQHNGGSPPPGVDRKFYAGQETWIAGQLYIDPTWPTSAGWAALVQLKCAEEGNGPFTIEYVSDRLGVTKSGDQSYGSTTGAITAWRAPATTPKGAVIKWCIGVYWSRTDSGWYEIWGDSADGQGYRQLKARTAGWTLKDSSSGGDDTPGVDINVYRDASAYASNDNWVEFVGVNAAATREAAEQTAWITSVSPSGIDIATLDSSIDPSVFTERSGLVAFDDEQLPSDTGEGGGTATWRIAGAVRATTAAVVIKTTAGKLARLRCATNTALTANLTLGTVATADSLGLATLRVSGLAAATTYYYGIEIGGQVDTARNGRFRTTATQAASLVVGFGSDMNADSASAVTLRARNPDLVVLQGDIAWMDSLGAFTESAFIGAWSSMIAARPNLAELVANAATEHTWSDHDFCGNNTTGDHAGADAANDAWRRIWPRLALPSTDRRGIYRSFVHGRIRIVITDGRSFKDAGTGTVLGTAQKAWFKGELQAAVSAGQLVVWCQDIPWIGTTASSGADDEWFGADYIGERNELGDFCISSGAQVIFLGGDGHMLAYDDGTNARGGNAGTSGSGIFMVCHGSPLHDSGSVKGGPFSGGTYAPASADCYGLLTITDTGGATVSVDFKGYDSANTQRISGAKTITVS